MCNVTSVVSSHSLTLKMIKCSMYEMHNMYMCHYILSFVQFIDDMNFYFRKPMHNIQTVSIPNCTKYQMVNIFNFLTFCGPSDQPSKPFEFIYSSVYLNIEHISSIVLFVHNNFVPSNRTPVKCENFNF